MSNLEAYGKDVIGLLANSNDVIGSMQIFAGSTVPAGYLLCDGREVSRTKYSELFEAIGTTWGAGDGSTTFNIPDMREVAPVGVGTSTRTEGNHDSFTLGEFKDDQMQNHTHSGNYGSTQQAGHSTLHASAVFSGSWTTTNPTGRAGDVTRGKRIGVNYIIKAKQIIIPIDVRDELDEIESDIDEINNDLTANVSVHVTSTTTFAQALTALENAVDKTKLTSKSTLEYNGDIYHIKLLRNNSIIFTGVTGTTTGFNVGTISLTDHYLYVNTGISGGSITFSNASNNQVSVEMDFIIRY